MALTVQESIDTTYLDVVHYDTECTFSRGYEALDNIVIKSANGLVPFVLSEGSLKTQEFSITAIVTHQQEALLRSLYLATVHPGYIDQRYPITISWGYTSAKTQIKCYLADYMPPKDIDYTKADILDVDLTLRAI